MYNTKREKFTVNFNKIVTHREIMVGGKSDVLLRTISTCINTAVFQEVRGASACGKLAYFSPIY